MARLTLEIPDHPALTRFDFGKGPINWVNWCQVDGRYYSGRGLTLEAANAEMMQHFILGASLGETKQKVLSVRALDGRTREGKLVKTAATDRIRDEDRNKDLKDLF